MNEGLYSYLQRLFSAANITCEVNENCP